uniref:Uncharacterized protein n=1 Tax=Anguilla anguilla TaxID=7936 RepID=A0A0E9V9V8_ANGAN
MFLKTAPNHMPDGRMRETGIYLYFDLFLRKLSCGVAMVKA